MPDPIEKSEDCASPNYCRCSPCNEQWTKHVLKTVRCDLALACDTEPKVYHWRYKSGIYLITRLLNDHDEWEALKQRWSKDDPDIFRKLHDEFADERNGK